MKRQITWKTLVLFFLLIILLGIFSKSKVIAQNAIFDATISTNKDVYYAHEEIIISYSFSSHVTENEYFAIGVGYNVSFEYFHQSEPIQGNFSVSEEYHFTLSKTNFTFSENSIVIYMMLYYYDELFGNEICCYTSVLIEKIALICQGPQNNTYIMPNTVNNFNFYLSNSQNASDVLKKLPINYYIFQDGVLKVQKLVYTDDNGSFSILINYIPNVQHYTLHINTNGSICFISQYITFLFITAPKDLTIRNRILISSIICSIIILCGGGVFGSVLYYKKNIKKRYRVEKLKI